MAKVEQVHEGDVLLATTSPSEAKLVKGVPSVDIAKGEKVEAELTHLIERRHDRRVVEEGHRPSEEMYEESTRRYQEQMRVRARYEWHLYHTTHAERVRRTLEELAAYHEEQAAKLIEVEPKGAA